MMRGNVAERGERAMGEDAGSAQNGLGEVAQKWTELDINGDLTNAILKDPDGSNEVTSDDAFEAVTQLFRDLKELLPKMGDRGAGHLQVDAFKFWWRFKIDKVAGKNADCNNLDELRKLYKLLWDSPANRSDTMCTVKTTFSKAKKFADITKADSSVNAWKRLEGWDSCVAGQLALLCYLTHTLGDFIPCWGNFNAGRYPSTRDYWDLTLLCVQNWYLHHQQYSETYAYENPLDEGVLTGCHTWLDTFGFGLVGWKAFVDKNYLQDWVDEGYHVMPLFLGHCFEHKLPQGSSEIRECLINMNARIIARGLRMRKRLQHLHDEAKQNQDETKAKEIEDTWPLFCNDPYPR
jgi:hypothetical protein